MAQTGSADAEHQQNGDGGKALGFFSFVPQLIVPASKADEAVQFYKAAFGAEEVKRVNHPKRKAEQDLPLVLSAEVKIGPASFLVCDQTDESFSSVNGTGGGIFFRLETEDVAGAVAKALEAGAVAEGEIVEAEGPCGGGLLGKVKDPFGVVWAIASAGKS
ncbi:Uncharacterized protein AXF42_Ash018417 [Apostasia shenzhenica]|uniref:VOC domain-containing protein n=1 Tax=Apostasia shenzhenica TaxID=1088818 RepID=A0A2I0BE95_9ASPA|nr:Uncharacterized protein AXF42_Ash018417 [Apostasia shenzhenica]